MARTPRAGRPMGRTWLFGESDRLALVRAQEDVIVAVGELGADQLVAFIQRQRAMMPRAIGIVELGQLRTS